MLNADDPRVAAFRSFAKDEVVTYGMSESADMRGEDLKLMPEGIEFTARGVRFRSSLTGRHGVLNVLAGLAVATLFRIKFEDLVDTVARLRPGKMRGERRVHGGITILDDSYNSNPDATRFMIDVLRAEPARRRVAVLGEMLELGSWAETLHCEVGAYAAKAGIDVLVGIHGAARVPGGRGTKCRPPGCQYLFF